MAYFVHIADKGDRWDTLAYIYWGDAGLVTQLVADNKHLPITEEIVEGAEVYIREEKPQTEEDKPTTDIPPWRA